MKILFVTYCRAMFGANLCMVSLIKDLKKRYGVESTVLMSDVNDGELEEVLKENNIDYIISPMKHWTVGKTAKLKYIRGILYSFKNKKYAKSIIKNCHIENYDLMYSNSSAVCFGDVIARMAKKPHIWHVREYGKLDYGYEYVYPLFVIQNAFSRASQIISVSNDLNNYIKKTIAKKRSPITIYDGIDCSKEIRRTWITQKKLQFVIVGVLQDGKNQKELIEAACILKRHSSDFHINIVGSGGQYEQELKYYVDKHNLQEFVTFWGHRKDVSALLDTMDIGVICSKGEAFGRVTCEYMNASMPVIGAASGATKELVKDGKIGYLYELDNANDLASKMLIFMNDKTLIQKMGTKAYEEVFNNYSIKSNTDKIYKEIEDITYGSKRDRKNEKRKRF